MRPSLPIACTVRLRWATAAHQLFGCVALAEFIDATAGIHDLLLARVERMAVGAHFEIQVAAGGARLKSIAAATRHGDLVVRRMDVSFHCRRRLRRRHWRP